MKRLLFIAAIAGVTILAGILLGRGWKTGMPPQKRIGKLNIAASFYPLSFFAGQIGGNLVMVTNITPAGAEPHDYEPTTRDIAHIEQSDILILNGQMEAWGDTIRDTLKDKKTVIVKSGDGLIQNNDPHVWLDPVLAKKEAQVIADALENTDPANAALYESNMAHLVEKFDSLNILFQKGLSHCEQKNIVTSHAAFGYIADRYHLNQVPIAGLSPDSEPSPKRLAEIAQFTKANNIRYIFFESLVSPRLAQTIADETGAKTLVFNPIEGLTAEEETRGADYFLLQKQNLDTLKIALSCQ